MSYEPRFPIYIVSKGRWETRFTSQVLESLGVYYRIVVEPQELDRYAEVIEREKILVLDMTYKSKYDTFSSLREDLGTGSGPARNFAWDHAIAAGAKWHWCMDDNIRQFDRMNNNRKNMVGDGAIFRAMEDFCLRYENVAMAGPHYRGMRAERSKCGPFTLNSRIYSCNLIRNDVPFRWRGRYNEDTDLSLRMLKSGWCTVLFNTFLQEKGTTLTLKGGNTDTIYMGTAGTVEKSKMIVDMHPDVCRLVKRRGHIHHYVDYGRFTHPLVRKVDAVQENSVNNYGMELSSIDARKFCSKMKPPAQRSSGRSTTG